MLLLPRSRLPSSCLLLLLAAASAGAAADSPMDIAMGAKVYAEQCWRCHETPDPATRDGRAWRAVSLHMRVFACLTRAEQQQLAAFLRYDCTAKAAAAAAAAAGGK